MKKFIVYFGIIALNMILSAENFQADHIQHLKDSGFNAIFQYKHETYTKTEGEYRNGKHTSNEIHYSLYSGKQFFSFYTKNIYSITKIKKTEKAIILETTCKIKNESIGYNVIFPISENFLGCAVHLNKKMTSFKNTDRILKRILSCSHEIYDAFQKKEKLCPQYIIVTEKIAEEIIQKKTPKTSRELVVESITWSIQEEQVKQFGNGTVIKYKIWYKGGVGKVEFEILDGYLFMTCIWGKRNGTGKIWQTKK